MKFFYGKGKKFQHKNITEDHPNDPKMLHVLLYEIEHDWAYGKYYTILNKYNINIFLHSHGFEISYGCLIRGLGNILKYKVL